MPPAYPWLVPLIVPTPTVPARNCDIESEPTMGILMGARPQMLSGSAVRWLVASCLAGAAGLSLVLGGFMSALSQPDQSDTGDAGTNRAVATTWVTKASDAPPVLTEGAGAWLLRTGAGDCLVAAQVRGAGQLQLAPTDPANPACKVAALATG